MFEGARTMRRTGLWGPFYLCNRGGGQEANRRLEACQPSWAECKDGCGWQTTENSQPPQPPLCSIGLPLTQEWK